MRARQRRRLKQSLRDRGHRIVGPTLGHMSRRLAVVYGRDHGMCHLCGLHVPSVFSVNSKIAPSLDHLVPRSKGGGDDYMNLALAHRICNETRACDPTHEVDGETLRALVRQVK